MNIKDLFDELIMTSDPITANKVRDIEILIEKRIAELEESYGSIEGGARICPVPVTCPCCGVVIKAIVFTTDMLGEEYGTCDVCDTIAESCWFPDYQPKEEA